VGPADRRAVNQGRADYYPAFLFEIPRIIRERVPLDMTVLQTSLPDEQGRISLGAEVGAGLAALEKARIKVALMNPNMPFTHGPACLPAEKFDLFVHVDIPLPQVPVIPISAVEKSIAEKVVEQIEDGSTLQIGIGGIPNAILELLNGKKDIGIHTELISDGIVQAVEKGIITNRCKKKHQGKTIASFVLGTDKVYKFADRNPDFEMHPVDYTNDPFNIAQYDRFVSINSAIEIDLYGQVCSDSIGYNIYSGYGGQVDFVRGASRSKGGKSIIALTSTTTDGKTSKIVPLLKEGAGVVTGRADVRYVCTEYGIVDLFGMPISKRAGELIKLAHPDFREGLERFARHKLRITGS
jgi:acyl-CoA hydrolase